MTKRNELAEREEWLRAEAAKDRARWAAEPKRDTIYTAPTAADAYFIRDTLAELDFAHVYVEHPLGLYLVTVPEADGMAATEAVRRIRDGEY